MTREGQALEECIDMGKKGLAGVRDMVKESYSSGDPYEKIHAAPTVQEFSKFLRSYGVSVNQMRLFLESSSKRRTFIRNNDAMLIRDIDRLIKEGKDIRGTMLQAIQSDTGNKAKETQKALFGGISSYEASISELSAYTLFNQIYGTTLVSDTLVIYGGKQMSYLEAQKALVNSIVEDNTAELKKECEAARGAKK